MVLFRGPDARWEGWLPKATFYLLLASAITYAVCVGHHRRTIEIKTPEGTVRLLSRAAHFRLALPGKPYEVERWLLGYDGTVTHGWERLLPLDVRGVGVTVVAQQLDLKTKCPTLEFTVNDRRIKLADGKVQAGGQEWELKPGADVEIFIDRLPVE